MHQPVASFWCVLIPKCQLACELHQASWTKHIYSTQTAKANPLCQDVISVQRAQGAELHALLPPGPRDRGTFACLCSHQVNILDLKAQDSCLPTMGSEVGWSWITGRVFYNFIFLLLFHFFQAVKWRSIQQWLVFVGSHWSCPALCSHRWSGRVQYLGLCGAWFEGQEGRGAWIFSGMLTTFCCKWRKLRKAWLSLLITSSIFNPLAEITVNFILSPLTSFDIDKNVFSLPLDEPHY